MFNGIQKSTLALMAGAAIVFGCVSWYSATVSVNEAKAELTRQIEMNQKQTEQFYDLTRQLDEVAQRAMMYKRKCGGK